MAQFNNVMRRALLQKLNLLPFTNSAVHDPYVGDRPAILVIVGVEYHRL